jgi:2-keto-4-pentenoate hydratase
MTPERIREAAELLMAARREGRTIDGLPEACRPATVDEGYAIQDALVALSGAQVVGWKLGATTPYWQKRGQLAEPIAGRLLSSFVHPSPASLLGGAFHLRMVESEYAFRLGRDLPARAEPYSREEVEDAIAAVHCCIEVADTRFRAGLRVDSPSLIADNVISAAYVVGSEVPDFRAADLTHAPVKVWVDGKMVRDGAGEHTGGHPILPLVWLANDRRKRGDGLAAGLLISTSSCTGAHPCASPAVVVADYGPLGSAQVTFTA